MGTPTLADCGLGERRKFPQRGPERNPAENDFTAFYKRVGTPFVATFVEY